MRRIIDIIRNLSLGFKLNAAVVSILVLILLAAIGLISFGVNDLSNRAGQQRIEDEVRIIQSRLTEAEQNTLSDAKLIASTPGLAEAVATEDNVQLRLLALTSSAPLNVDDIDVVNKEGVRHLEITDETVNEGDHEAEDRLLSRALLGIETTGLVATTGENAEILIAATVPLRDAEGTIIGGLIISREIDDEFLEQIDFGRQGVHLLLIQSGEIVAQYVAEEESANGEADQEQVSYGSIITTGLAENAARGQISINQALILGHDEVYAEAHIPLSDDYTEASVAVLVNMDDFFHFRGQLTRNLILSLSLIGSIALLGLAFLIQKGVSSPLRDLQAVAEKMSLGNYWRRASVRSNDEIGQLAIAFNTMANAVQSRTTELNNLTASLEDQVETRTAELREQATRLAKTNRDLVVARKQAEDANKLKSEFLSTMSHELRTPLNAINGYTQIMLAGMTGPFSQEQHEYLDRIWSNGNHLLRLINDVLDLAKIEAGRIDIVKEPFGLREWLDGIVSQVQGLADEKKLDFEVTFDERMPGAIVADSDRLRQVAINLLSNAIKFTDKGSVKLAIRRQGKDKWELAVSDTGIGIPSHAQEYIFDEFRQVDGSSRRQHGGTGLGLAIVRNLCLMMSGNIRVKSQVGEGSTFTVLLPLDPAVQVVV